MRKNIPEVHYRASRICRVLGNPTAYEVLKTLAKNNMQPSEIADTFGLSVPTICDVLRSLRQLDLVRYTTVERGKIYFLKDLKILSVLEQLEHLVERIKAADY